MQIKFTGEFFIPGESSQISEEEHLERYKFAANYAKGKRILDIACGIGYGSKMLSEAGASHVLGCDISENNIKYATNKYQSVNLAFKAQDASQPLWENEFDLIVCFETIEHIDNFGAVLNNLHASLKVNGKMIISSPNRKITNPYAGPNESTGDYHVREFTIDELKLHLVASNFKHIEIYGQRQQHCFDNSFIEKHYKRLFKPSRKASPQVDRIKDGLVPEYVVMIGSK